MGKTIGSNFNITPPDIGASLSEHHKTIKHFSFIALVATCVSLAVFSSGVYADTASSSSQEVGGRMAPNSVTVSAGNTAINLDLIRTSSGSLAVGKDEVTVNVGSGTYQLYISGANIGANGYTSLYYDGNVGSTSEIKGMPSDTPAAFSTLNQWGFAVASEVAGSGSGYSSSSAYNSAASAGTITDRSTINNLKVQGSKNRYKLLRTGNSSSNTTDVYYAIYVGGDGLTAGTYKNSVIYTAFADGANGLEVYPFNVGNGDTMAITAEYQSSSLPITNAIQIAVQLLDGDTSVGNCNNINIVNNGASDLLKFTCRIATNANFQASKTYDVAVKLTPQGANNPLSFAAAGSWGDYIIRNGMTMQDLATNNFCKMAKKYSEDGKTYQLVDSRTSKSYLVRKLDDGNCWMTQNLYLEGGKSIVTQNGNSYTLPSSGTAGYGSGDTSTARMYNGTHSDNTADSDSNTGSFFSWITATAGTGNYYGQTDLVSPTTAGGAIASDSVCPQGWKLPTGGSGGDFDNLYVTEYDSDYSNFNLAWSGSPIGNCRSGSCTDSQGSRALWWSATQANNRDGYRFSMYSSSFDPTLPYNKYLGLSIRCMLSGN